MTDNDSRRAAGARRRRAFRSPSSSHPAGTQTVPFPVFLSASAPLRELSAAWIPLRCCGGTGRFGSGPAMATTAMRLVNALGANPGLSSFLGQPWARCLNAVGVGRAWNPITTRLSSPRRRVSMPLALAGHGTGGVKRPTSPAAIPATLRETTPCLLRVFASSREVSALTPWATVFRPSGPEAPGHEVRSTCGTSAWELASWGSSSEPSGPPL
jgi:hypothetical protein